MPQDQSWHLVDNRELQLVLLIIKLLSLFVGLVRKLHIKIECL
jgi:hypothetical protein